MRSSGALSTTIIRTSGTGSLLNVSFSRERNMRSSPSGLWNVVTQTATRIGSSLGVDKRSLIWDSALRESHLGRSWPIFLISTRYHGGSNSYIENPDQTVVSHKVRFVEVV